MYPRWHPRACQNSDEGDPYRQSTIFTMRWAILDTFFYSNLIDSTYVERWCHQPFPICRNWGCKAGCNIHLFVHLPFTERYFTIPVHSKLDCNALASFWVIYSCKSLKVTSAVPNILKAIFLHLVQSYTGSCQAHSIMRCHIVSALPTLIRIKVYYRSCICFPL